MNDLSSFDYATLLIIIGGLTVLTNLLTEVIKPFTQIKLPTEITATVIAEILTLLGYFGWSDFKGIPVVWYTVVAAVVVGMLVSYAAQFGFDKLKSALGEIHNGTKGN